MMKIRMVDGEETGIVVDGHAGYAPPGEDIVCSAITALMYTIAHAMVDMDQNGMLKEPPTIDINEGHGVVKGKIRKRYQHEGDRVMTAVGSTIVLICGEYPDYVQLI